MRVLIAALLISLITAPASADVGRAIDHARTALSNRRLTVKQRRAAVAGAVRAARKLAQAQPGMTAVWNKIRWLRLEAYDHKAMEPALMPVVRRLETLQATLLKGRRSARVVRELAMIGRRLRKASKRGAPVLALWRDVTALDRYLRALDVDSKTAYAKGRPNAVSVEAETDIADGVIRMMRTKDGTIGALVDGIKVRRVDEMSQGDRAAWVREKKKVLSDKSADEDKVFQVQLEDQLNTVLPLLKQYADAKGVKIGQLKWDDVGKNLGSAVQLTLLASATIGSSWSDATRQISYVEIPKGERPVGPNRNIKLNGKSIRRGQLLRGAIFQSHVEFGGPKHAKRLGGVEIHRQTRGQAGKVSSETFNLLWSLGSSMRSQHMHMLLQPKRFTQKPQGAFRLADHWRRSNLFGELLAALQFGDLVRIQKGATSYFGFTEGDDVRNLYRHLNGTSGFLDRLEGTSLKIAAVGYRFGMYKDPETGEVDRDMAGYEARQINVGKKGETPAKKTIRETWLSAMQRGLLTGNLGYGLKDLRAHFGRHNFSASRIGELHYNRTISRTDMSPAIRKLIGQSRAAEKLINNRGQTDPALRMLVHNWSMDTIWIGLSHGQRKAALARLEAAQIQAIRALTRGVESKKVIQAFVLQSGLFQATARSLGMYGLKPTLDMSFDAL